MSICRAGLLIAVGVCLGRSLIDLAQFQAISTPSILFTAAQEPGGAAGSSVPIAVAAAAPPAATAAANDPGDGGPKRSGGGGGDGVAPTRDAVAAPGTSPLESSTSAFHRERYGHLPPSPRVKRHPKCNKDAATGKWQWFSLLADERSRVKEDERIFQWFFADSNTTGTYVELGAFDGKTESNTRFFDECLGWEGLLIEGNPAMKEKIIRNRPHAHKMFFAPSCKTEGTNQTVKFHSVPFTNVGQQGVVEAYKGEQGKVVEVPCGPLSPVLESVLNGHVNFFSLDVEGAEPLVIDTIDWNKIKIDVMISESENSQCRQNCKSRMQVRDAMKKAGYKLYIDGITLSDLFVHPSIAKAPPPQYVEGYSGRRQASRFNPKKKRTAGLGKTMATAAAVAPLPPASLAFYRDRYGYTPPAPRGSRHPKCEQDSAGRWQWFEQGPQHRSRGGEDAAIYEWFFRDLEGGRGTYVELGAFDGTSESNSRFFDECLEWDGLLIEGNPAMKQKLLDNRPHAHKMFYAPSCQKEGTNETVAFHSRPYTNVGQQGIVKAYRKDRDQLAEVPCGPLSPVLEKVLSGHVNFFSLDVEGAEPWVVSTIDWTKVKVDVMIIESENKQCRKKCPARAAVRETMKRAGYKLYIDGIFRSDLFVHPSITKTPPARFVEGYSDRRQQASVKDAAVKAPESGSRRASRSGPAGG